MKTRTRMIAASLLLAALPVAAQADQATERALQLNQEPLAAVDHRDDASAQDVARDADAADWGASDAMAKARLNLRAQHEPVKVAAHGEPTALARQATQS